ncbi:MAG: ATP phosphoribosyltransferase [Mariprofundaceae bacterium]|nr:ATP phosphoribosyltransferase [Mariprofundaceae bacterium]
MSDKPVLTIALSKGRILEQTLPLLAFAGLLPQEDVQKTRKLMVDGPDDWAGSKIRFLIIRAADVCTYVEKGAADLGISGRDLLMELRPHVYEPLDLKIGKCRLSICAPKETIEAERSKPAVGGRIRIATKYDYLTEQYYQQQGIQADIIHLYGSMELAPLVGLADRIVDVVETGNTLKANGLQEEVKLFDISSRLIANPASFVTKKRQVQAVIEKMRLAVQGMENS